MQANRLQYWCFGSLLLWEGDEEDEREGRLGSFRFHHDVIWSCAVQILMDKSQKLAFDVGF